MKMKLQVNSPEDAELVFSGPLEEISILLDMVNNSYSKGYKEVSEENN